ncbi:MAG: DNRLRE domain-containing protein [Acidobacteriota bacterium]|nr:DNRLRE domain-containing protein [Acidobacteriota bacterium]
MDSRTILCAGVRIAAGLALAAATAIPATAQTLTLTESSATVLRGGAYANTNLSSDTLLATRASSDATYARRIILKFDTANTLPPDTPIANATLTLTVAGGNGESRTISTYRVRSSYDETETTWNRRYNSTTWPTAGADLAERYGTASVTNTSGRRVTFDVTALVQGTVNGSFGSRYSRIALVDAGGSSRDSFKQYFSDEAADVTVRPLLTVTYGSAAPAPAPTPVATTSGSTLKVLDWNIHHGVGTDGKYDIDRIASAIARTGAHVVSLNEVERYTGWGNEDQPARFVALLEAKTGRRWYYNFATSSGTTRGQGNLLLSTLPIDSAADGLLSYDRSVAQARIVVNGRSVNLFSVHLDADSATRRTTQITQLKSWMGQFSEARIVAGDFNAWPGATEIKGMTSAFRDAWAEAKIAGTAVAYSGNEAGNTRNSRIDYVFLSRGATNVILKGARVFDFRDAAGVMPSDHRPVMAIYEVR